MAAGIGIVPLSSVSTGSSQQTRVDVPSGISRYTFSGQLSMAGRVGEVPENPKTNVFKFTFSKCSHGVSSVLHEIYITKGRFPKKKKMKL